MEDETFTLAESERLLRAMRVREAKKPVLCRDCRRPIPKARQIRRKRDLTLLGYSCGKCGWAEGLGVRRT